MNPLTWKFKLFLFVCTEGIFSHEVGDVKTYRAKVSITLGLAIGRASQTDYSISHMSKINF